MSGRISSAALKTRISYEISHSDEKYFTVVKLFKSTLERFLEDD